MDKEELKKIDNEISDVLKSFGVSNDELESITKKLSVIEEKKKAIGFYSSADADVIGNIVKGALNQERMENRIVESIVNAIKNLKIEPNVTVNPEFKIPEPRIIVKEPQRPNIIVNPTPVEVKPADVNIPDEIKIKGIGEYIKSLIGAIKGKLNVGLENITRESPMPVVLIYDKKSYKAGAIMEGENIMMGGSPSRVYIKNKNNETVDPQEAVGSPHAYALTMITSGSPYSQALPNNTAKLTIKLRDIGANLQIAWESGGNYTTLPVGATYPLDGVKLVNRTLYLTADASDQVAEITAWTKE